MSYTLNEDEETLVVRAIHSKIIDAERNGDEEKEAILRSAGEKINGEPL